MELTKEYFDKGLANLLENVSDRITGLESKMATKEDIAAIRAEMVTKDELVVTKNELQSKLKEQTQELKQYVHEAFETQQVWMEHKFGELIVKYDVRERVIKLEKDVAEIKLSHAAHV